MPYNWPALGGLPLTSQVRGGFLPTCTDTPPWGKGTSGGQAEAGRGCGELPRAHGAWG